MKTPMEIFITELKKVEMPYKARYEVLDMAVKLANDSLQQGVNIVKEVRNHSNA